MKTQLDNAIDSKLTSDNTLCTDAWRAFSSYAKSEGLEHYHFISDGTEHVKRLYHIQNVNNYYSRLKCWMQRFNGVATKYPDNYLSWFQFIDIVKHRSDNVSISKMIVDICLFPINETYSHKNVQYSNVDLKKQGGRKYELDPKTTNLVAIINH